MEKVQLKDKVYLNNIKNEPQSTIFRPSPTKCLCHRPKTNVLCNNCGNVMFGRIHYRCTIHSKVTFLCDINKCNLCFANFYMLSEVLDPSYVY